jgi:osmoprotectant transport system permease protein
VEALEFLRERGAEIAVMTLDHLVLVAISTALAVAFGVPLGILLTRRPSLAGPVLGFANVMQTVPSLALFGFLIPIPWIGGIGDRTAVLALVLYALLPILRNTYAGIRSVDPSVVEAGRGMGMTDLERLRLIEVPLALPTILAGVRIATVVSVGLATIAAAVGAHGLGNLIFRGLSMLDSRLILAGAIPAAALAITADALLGVLERRLGAAR